MNCPAAAPVVVRKDDAAGARARAVRTPDAAHLDVAYGLARWLTRNDELAKDVVQEAYLRALRFFGSLRGDGRPWLLKIVRNACLDLLEREQHGAADEPFDEEQHGGDVTAAGP